MLPVVLFDLDGTLVDTVELILSSARFAFASRPGPAPTDEEFVSQIGIPLTTQIRPYVRDEAELAALLTAYRTHQLEHHDRLTRCFDGVLETVSRLAERGHHMAIVTSKGDAIARHSLAHVGLDRYIDVVIGCDSCTRHKPDPEPVHIALERLGATPAQAVFVGDSPFDIAAGNAAGVVSIAALWGPFTRAKLEAASPRYYLERIEDLIPVLERHPFPFKP